MSRRKSPLELGRPERGLAGEHLAGAAVDRDPLALGELTPVHREVPGPLVHLQLLRADHARLPHAARHDRGVRRHAAAGGEDGLGHHHAVEVLGRGLAPDQDHRLARAAELLGAVGVEHDRAAGGARRGRQARW